MSITSLLHKTSLIQIPMRLISGIDPELNSCMQEAGFSPGLLLDPNRWEREVLEALYFQQLLLVVERGVNRKGQHEAPDVNVSLVNPPIESDQAIRPKASERGEREVVYQVVGSVLSLPLAEELYQPDDLVFVQCIQAERIAKRDKYALLAAELLGSRVLHMQGKRAPRIGEKLWEVFRQRAFNALRGDRLSDYKSATRSTYR